MELDYLGAMGGVQHGYRSRGEVQIARLLERNGIAYKYEHPVAVIDRGKTKIWHPDFYLPEYAMIIEYFGINGNRDYDERTEFKKKVYGENGIEGLFLTEQSLKGDWPTKIMGQIEDTLKDRLDRFYNRQGSRQY